LSCLFLPIILRGITAKNRKAGNRFSLRRHYPDQVCGFDLSHRFVCGKHPVVEGKGRKRVGMVEEGRWKMGDGRKEQEEWNIGMVAAFPANGGYGC